MSFNFKSLIGARRRDRQNRVAELEGQVKAISKSQAVIEFDMDGTIRHANDNFLNTLGYTLDELRGQHHRMLVTAAEAQSPEYARFWAKLGHGEYDAGRYKRLGKNGREVWIQASYNPVFDADGRPFKVVKYATDITQQIMDAADSEGRLSAISKTQAVIEFEMDGRIRYANDNFLSALGYTLEEVRGRHHRMFVSAEEAKSSEYTEFWDKLGRGEYDDGLYKRFGKNGREVWIQASYNPVFDADGRPFKVVKYANDVTQQLMQTADFSGQLQAISKAQAVIEFELDGTIRHANDNFLKTLGYSLAEIRGQHHRMLVTPEEAQSTEYAQFWAKLGRGEYDAGQYKRLGKGGREIWIQASYNPIFDANDRPFKIVKYATDVTKQVTQAADYQGQIEAISKSQAVIEFDMDGTIRYANDNFLSALGYTLDEIRGQHHRLFVTPEERDSVEYARFWAGLGRGEYYAGEYKRIGKDGSEVWIQANYNPICDNEGRPFKVVKYFTYVTEQVEARRATERVVEQAQNVVAAARDGDLSQRIPAEDEKGLLRKLCDGVNAMLDDIQSARDAERVVAAANLRVKNALDNVSANVMIVDNDGCIIYGNESLIEMLGNAEADLRRELPKFAADKLVGSSVDVFKKAPALKNHMLTDTDEPYPAEFEIGGRTLSLTVNSIADGDGERLGTVVEWLDRTAEVAVETELAGIVEAAASGEFSHRLRLEDKTGFFARLARGMNDLLTTSEAGLNDVARVLGALAKGDLTETIEAEYQGTFGRLKTDANATVTYLKEIVSGIQSASGAIDTAAREIASGNSDLASRTEQQASSLQETASSMEEFTSTVKQNADNAGQANELAIGARDVAKRGGEVVEQVVTTMSDISESSNKIGDIIGVIEDIAFQTNILALNAAVEAARAGDQGRGFAVVASEVRSLAQRSSAAAKQIKELIGDSVTKVENGSELVSQAGKTMEEIVDAVKRVTNIMGEISVASGEQSSGIEQVNQTVTQMDEVAQQNAALVEQASACAHSLEEQAAGLVQSVQVFRLEAGQVSEQPIRMPAANTAASNHTQAGAHETANGYANGYARAALNGSNGHGKNQDEGSWAEF